MPTGSMLWRFKYRFGGVEKLISLGKYPLVSLEVARKRRDEARRAVANGLDPSADRRARKPQDELVKAVVSTDPPDDRISAIIRNGVEFMGSPINHEEIRRTLARNVNALCKLRGFSQNALSKKCRLSQKQINNVCRAKTGCGIDALMEIADALGVKPWMLLMEWPVTG